MRMKTEDGAGKQTAGVLRDVGERVTQALLPMMEGVLSAKQDLLAFMQAMGHAAVKRVFEDEVGELVGPAGKHQRERKRYRWGTVAAEFTLGGRRVTLARPRVRERGGERAGKGGQEVPLASVAQFQSHDALPETVLNQILLGVTTRKYAGSLEAVPKEWDPHGTSKSSASRHLVATTRKKVAEFLSRRLDDVALAALMVDGVEIGKHTVVVALGITQSGEKVPLGLEVGSTENAALCVSLLQSLLSRGLKVGDRVLCVIDGGKGIRRAIDDVLGDMAVIQRCQVHKRRNVLRLVPERCHAYVRRAMKDAYASGSADAARKQLKRLSEWLEREGHDSAAASLREGLEETLAVLKLGLSGALRDFFATTNPIENMIGTLRDVSHNVKRWQKGDMVKRWAGIGLVQASKRFRRIKGHGRISTLIVALRGQVNDAVDTEEKVA